MILTYGDIEFQMLFLRSVDRRPRFDEDQSTYLWTDWTIDCIVSYNPKQTSYRNNNGVMAPTPDIDAVLTDKALWNYLNQPRRRLKLATSPEAGVQNIWVESPKEGKTTDFNHGPKCMVQSIETPTGNGKTFVCHLVFETSINDCTSDHILLSHRWRRYLDVDADHLTTIVTEGVCVFNLPRLVEMNSPADAFRRAVIHPIPDNFRREHVGVFPGSDGYTYRYQTIDREQMYNLGSNCPAIRVEAYLSGGYEDLGYLGAIGRAGRSWTMNRLNRIGEKPAAGGNQTP